MSTDGINNQLNRSYATAKRGLGSVWEVGSGYQQNSRTGYNLKVLMNLCIARLKEHCPSVQGYSSKRWPVLVTETGWGRGSDVVYETRWYGGYSYLHEIINTPNITGPNTDCATRQS